MKNLFQVALELSPNTSQDKEDSPLQRKENDLLVPTNPIIQVYLKRSYGTDRYYPINQIAQMLIFMSKRKCFEKQELDALQAQGAVIDIKKESI